MTSKDLTASDRFFVGRMQLKMASKDSHLFVDKRLPSLNFLLAGRKLGWGDDFWLDLAVLEWMGSWWDLTKRDWKRGWNEMNLHALRIFLIWIMIALNMACLEARWHREDDPILNETEVMKMEAQVLWVSFYPSIGRASQHRWEMDLMEDREGLDLFSWRGLKEVHTLDVLSLLLLLLLDGWRKNGGSDCGWDDGGKDWNSLFNS